jgi:hypothetical protein
MFLNVLMVSMAGSSSSPMFPMVSMMFVAYLYRIQNVHASAVSCYSPSSVGFQICWRTRGFHNINAYNYVQGSFNSHISHLVLLLSKILIFAVSHWAPVFK